MLRDFKSRISEIKDYIYNYIQINICRYIYAVIMVYYIQKKNGKWSQEDLVKLL